MEKREKWQWQEPGTAWRGAGLYHFTLTVSSREPMLGKLVVPGNEPQKAVVRRTPLGDALVDYLLGIPSFHPEVEILHFCLMPDHLHAVLYVRRTMPCGIRMLARGFWQGAKKLGRAWAAASSSSFVPNNIRDEFKEGQGAVLPGLREGSAHLKEESARLKAFAETLRERLGNDAYYRLPSVFEEMPFIRAMGRYSQLPATIRYIDMNPQRLATKRLMPGFFSVQKDIVIGERKYDGVGNVGLLQEACFDTVHVHRELVKSAEQGDDTSLRNYMNSCVLKARKGVVLVSPFISPKEKMVLQVLLSEQRPLIYLAINGFRNYYKPAGVLFDACAAGRLLILSPWQYDEKKKSISRSDCVELNSMADVICNSLNKPCDFHSVAKE